MKAVVMENKNKVCAVLCDDGTFRKINGDYPVGTELIYENVVKNNKNSKVKKFLSGSTVRYLAGLAAAVLLFVGVSSYQMAFACSYVTLDVNPSIEYALNRLNKVISVTAINDDAKEIVESLENSGIKMTELNEAIDMTVDELVSRGYLADDDGAVLIDVVSDDENRESVLTENVEYTMAYHTENVVCLTSTKESRDEANRQGISAGRYEVMLETRKAEAEAAGLDETQVPAEVDAESVETYKNLTVKELINEIKINNGEMPEEMTDTKEPSEMMQDNAGSEMSAPSDIPENMPEDQNAGEMTTAPGNGGTENGTMTGTENGSKTGLQDGTAPELSSGQDKTQMNGKEGTAPSDEGTAAPTGTAPEGQSPPGATEGSGYGGGITNSGTGGGTTGTGGGGTNPQTGGGVSGSGGAAGAGAEGQGSQSQNGQMNNGGGDQAGGQMNGQGNANGGGAPGNP